MKPNARQLPPTALGIPFQEGLLEDIDPKTGIDPGNIMPGSIELMPATIAVAPGVTHSGDMGRLGKSE